VFYVNRIDVGGEVVSTAIAGGKPVPGARVFASWAAALEVGSFSFMSSFMVKPKNIA